MKHTTLVEQHWWKNVDTEKYLEQNVKTIFGSRIFVPISEKEYPGTLLTCVNHCAALHGLIILGNTLITENLSTAES